LVAAAFVGPGTVTTCTLAGAKSGYGLVWALAFSVVATMVLQDMAARLGARGRIGLGTALVQGRGPVVRAGLVILMLGALAVGNAAYEAGNMVGAVVGLELLLDQSLPRGPSLVVLGLMAAVGLAAGGLGLLQPILTAVVVSMSLAFGLAFFGSGPRLGALFAGFAPLGGAGDADLAVALIGTTVVPYNLFLHASASRAQPGDDVAGARVDGALAIGLGGLVSMFVLGTAAELGAPDVEGPAALALGLEAVLGSWGRIALGLGLLAAGLSSALTAPLATGLVVQELFPGRRGFLVASFGVLACGVVIGVSQLDPLALIVTAQATNGLLLPIAIAFLLVAMNRRSLLGEHVNGPLGNLAGGAVLLLGVALGLRLLLWS